MASGSIRKMLKLGMYIGTPSGNDANMLCVLWPGYLLSESKLFSMTTYAFIVY
jgi:hypothetical protein